MNILREVSELKNNCYELKRSVWNDVMEDWPFYSEAERSQLRRRKPQNLTPPVSDTGSTSSGHSPSSTNPASPPQITNPLKRHGGGGFYESPHRHHNSAAGASSSEPNPKKKRVSHYKRPDSAASGHGGTQGWSTRRSSSQHGSSPSMFGTVSPSFGGGSSCGSGGASIMLGSSPKTTANSLDSRLEPNSTFVDESAPDWGQFYDHDQQQPPVVSSAVMSQRSAASPEAPAGRSPATAFGLPDLGRSPVAAAGPGFSGAGTSQRTAGSSPAKHQQQPLASAGWTPESDGESGTAGGVGSSQLNMQLHCDNSNKDFLTWVALAIESLLTWK